MGLYMDKRQNVSIGVFSCSGDAVQGDRLWVLFNTNGFSFYLLQVYVLIWMWHLYRRGTQSQGSLHRIARYLKKRVTCPLPCTCCGCILNK